MTVEPEDLTGLTDEQKTARAEFKEIFDATILPQIKKQPGFPQNVFHYTQPNGFVGIIESNSLWASRADFLNDSSELDLGRRMFNYVIEQNGYRDASRHSPIISRLADDLHKMINQGPVNDVFMTCFCEDSDLLSQWRGYGKAGGISIGLASLSLIGAMRQNNGRLIRVIYNRVEQYNFFADITQQIFTRLPKYFTAGTQGEAIYKAFLFEAFFLIEWALPFLKHEKFAEEKEIRYVVRQPRAKPTLEVRHRVSGSRIIPYTPLKWLDENKTPKLFILQVRCGPTPHGDLQLEAITSVLRQNGYNAVTPVASEIPYRE